MKSIFRALVFASVLATASADQLIKNLTMSGASNSVAAGSTLTISGTLNLSVGTITWPTQTANTVFAGPASGAAAAPTFRTLASTELSDTSSLARADQQNFFLNSGNEFTDALTIRSGLGSLRAAVITAPEFTGNWTLTLPDATGTFALVNGNLGTPSSLTLTNATGLPVAGGGTGVASLTAYAPIFGGTTSTGAVQSGTVGTAGHVLTSNGAGALPTFQAAASGGVTSIATTSPISGGTITSTGTISLLTNVDFSFTLAQTMTLALAANTAGTGWLLTNTTTATSGNQRYSPAVRWTGQGWKTNATAASQAVDWRAYVVPVQGAAAPTSTLTFDTGVNGGAFSTAATLSATGLTVPLAGSSSAMPITFGSGSNSGFWGSEGGSPYGIGFKVQGQAAIGYLTWTSLGSGVGVDQVLLGATTRDVGFTREAAGIARLNDGGTATNYRDLRLSHVLAGGTAPTVAAGAGAGTSPTVSVTSGTQDMAGQISVTTGTTPTVSAVVATITRNRAMPGGSWPVISPANAAAAALTGTAQVFAANASTTTWTITVGSGGLPASTGPYLWNFHDIGY